MHESDFTAFVESFDDLYHNAQCGYLSWKVTGEIVRVNNTFCSWLGYSEDQLVGRKKITDFFPVSGRIYYETHFAPLLFIQGSAFEIQLDLLTSTGEKLPVLINAVLKETSENPSRQFIRATLFDIRQRKRYEHELMLEKRRAEDATEKLKQMNTELEQFAQLFSHDIRSPLSGIYSLSELLLLDLDKSLSPKIKKSLTLIHNSSKQLNRYIEGLLNFYKSEQVYCVQLSSILFNEFITIFFNSSISISVAFIAFKHSNSVFSILESIITNT
jgi:sigma-B regulation protein RsbU (phosphoserine phosphatase)